MSQSYSPVIKRGASDFDMVNTLSYGLLSVSLTE